MPKSLDMSGKIPDMPGKIPDMPGKIPGVSGKIPDMSGKIPGVSGKIPDKWQPCTTHPQDLTDLQFILFFLWQGSWPTCLGSVTSPPANSITTKFKYEGGDYFWTVFFFVLFSLIDQNGFEMTEKI